MMKRFTRFFSSLLLFLLVAGMTAFTVSAEGTLSATTVGAAGLSHIEGGGKLTSEEVNELEALAKEVSESTNAGVYVVFSDAAVADGEVEALSILKSKRAAGGGYGENDDAIILYVNFSGERTFSIVEDSETHEFRLSSKFVTRELADNSKIRSLLSDGDNAGAARQFLNDVRNELNPNIFKALWWRILAALGIGGGAAGIAAGSHKTLAKTKKRHYLRENKIAVLEKNERLVNTSVQRNTLKSKEASSTDHEVGSGAHGGSNTF